jgi:hypothetical protein
MNISDEFINPVSVARAFLERVKNEFSFRNFDESPNVAKKQVADLLFEK